MNNVVELPNTGYAPSNTEVARHLREQADWADAENAKDIRTVFMIVEYADGSLVRQTFGANCDLARAIGVMQIVINRAGIGQG